MYVKKIDEIKTELVTMNGVKDTYIQWLINKENAGAKNFAMRRFTIKPGGEIGVHSHDWEHEIYVLKGKGKLGAGDESANVHEDMVIYVPPNIDHWYKNTGKEDLVFLCMIPIKD
ncbi:MAG: cupin domain-containing protein [Candidatus Odinarchaeia archaeon]